jgi:hypothetical protein
MSGYWKEKRDAWFIAGAAGHGTPVEMPVPLGQELDLAYERAYRKSARYNGRPVVFEFTGYFSFVTAAWGWERMKEERRLHPCGEGAPDEHA